MTYNRRYLQSNMLNIPTAIGEDDDGEATQDRNNGGKEKATPRVKRPVMATAQKDELI